MTNMFYGIMGFMIGGCFGVGLMAIAGKDAYLDGYRDAFTEMHRKNQAAKRKKESERKA